MADFPRRRLHSAALFLAILLIAKCHTATAGGLDPITDATDFDPCAQPIPPRESYLATVVGPDAEQVYALQLRYHAWLCDDAAPAIIPAPPVIRLADTSDDTKLHWVFPGGDENPTPAPVPLPATALLLALAIGVMGGIKTKGRDAA